MADTPEAAVAAAQQLTTETGTQWWVVKSQIHAGGRGKGKIVGTEQRGVVLAKSLEDLKTIATNILGNYLVTAQTGANGKKVNKVLIAQDVYYPGAEKHKNFTCQFCLIVQKEERPLCIPLREEWISKVLHTILQS